LFDTKTTDFNSVKTAAGRDLVAEYVQAFRDAGLRVGLYYSIMNWQWPAICKGPWADPDGWEAMVQETHAQVRELMSNYGKIDLLWYDGGVVPGVHETQIRIRYWQAERLNAMVRSLQPDILINNRSGLPEDFSTPEQRVNPPQAGRRWEACMTLNQSWGYNIHDRAFKSAGTLKQALIRCARYGGNLLLGIGPRADGSIQQEFVTRLEKVGRWLATNGQAIYDSQRNAYTEAQHAAGPVTQHAQQVYFHLASYCGSTVRLDGVGSACSVELLGWDGGLSFRSMAGEALEVSGFSSDMPWQDGPLVLKVTLPHVSLNASNCLGGGDALRITAGNAPVLGFDADRYNPSVMPVYTGGALSEMIDQQRYAVAEHTSEDWCPGWCDWQVFAPRQDHTLSIRLDVPVDNTYQLDLGIIASGAGKIQMQIDNPVLNETFEVTHPGCPDTWRLPALVLKQGAYCLTLRSETDWGLYALQRNACWRTLPANQWMTIGPFHTNYEPQSPLNEVLEAMQQVYPPQEAYEPEKTYDGARGLKLRWTYNDQCEGDHSEAGVNFPYRCGDQVTGVCYARTVIVSPEDREAEILIGCDWWSNVWLNEQLLQGGRSEKQVAQDGAQFNGWKPRSAKMHLKQGRNVLLVKCHPGNRANWFTCRISDPGDLQVLPED
jgi:hypothetical protein